jgi:hypothetical protein
VRNAHRILAEERTSMGTLKDWSIISTRILKEQFMVKWKIETSCAVRV